MALATIYSDYPLDTGPPTDPSSTRFVCISDNHSKIHPVPPGDVLLHAGDLSSWGYLSQLDYTIKWLKKLPHPTKIIIAGNHDFCLDEAFTGCSDLWDTDTPDCNPRAVIEAIRSSGIHYLQHEAIEITTHSGKTWKVYGSPAAPRYAYGAFQYTNGEEADELYSRIPKDIDVLLTHTPAFGTLDLTRKGVHAGCKNLATAIGSLSQCRLHVFGHIHEAHGAQVIDNADNTRQEMVSVNAALSRDCPPIIVDIQA